MIIVNIIIYIFDTYYDSNTQIRLFKYTVNMFPVGMPKYAGLFLELFKLIAIQWHN